MLALIKRCHWKPLECDSERKLQLPVCWSMSLYSARVAVSHWVRNKSALQGRRMPSVFLGCYGKVQPSGA